VGAGRVQRLYLSGRSSDAGDRDAEEVRKYGSTTSSQLRWVIRGVISHVIDDTGEATSIHPRVTPKVTNFP
jgi:hypothetical protein